jgi:hypothetical protein
MVLQVCLCLLQVFPLLMQNFSFEEQAALVWQFMCCIPVNLLEEVLPWVAAELNPQERQEMVAHIHDVVPSEELLLEVSKVPPVRSGARCLKSNSLLPDVVQLYGLFVLF